eukprot:1436631-Prymnesium_polylepis.1
MATLLARWQHWTIGAGESFGEMPLLFSKVASAASYVAGEGGCKLLAFPEAAFVEMFSNNLSLVSEVLPPSYGTIHPHVALSTLIWHDPPSVSYTHLTLPTICSV